MDDLIRSDVNARVIDRSRGIDVEDHVPALTLPDRHVHQPRMLVELLRSPSCRRKIFAPRHARLHSLNYDISFEHVSKSFGPHTVLRDVPFPLSDFEELP